MNVRLLSALALAGVCMLEAAARSQPVVPEANSSSAAPQANAGAPVPPQQATDLQAPSVAPAPCCKLPALTPVELEILTPASSKTSKQGDQIQIRVIENVTVDGKVVIPEGTEGSAEVIQASHGAFGGKAGELVIGAPYLMLAGQRVGLKRFRYGPVSGRDSTQTAMIVSAAAGGVWGLVIGGGNIDVASGARANAVVTADTQIPVQQ